MEKKTRPEQSPGGNVSKISRGPYADEPVTESDVLAEEWFSTLDPEVHRLSPRESED